MNGVYEEAASLLLRLNGRNTSFRKLIFDSNQQNKKLLYKICFETMSRRQGFAEILNHLPELAEDEVFAGFSPPFIQYVLLYEHLFGHGLHRCDRSWSRAIEKYSDKLSQLKNDIFGDRKKFLPVNPNNEQLNSSAYEYGKIKLPRYARVNTLKITVEEAKKQLCDSGWIFVETSLVSRKKYRALVDNLPQYHFFVDAHVSDLIVFSSGTDLHEEALVVDGSIILQDKSSCLPTLCLDLQPNVHVMDMCAAPGVKTSHIAALMHNEGVIFAFDNIYDRFKLMEEMLAKCNIRCAVLNCYDMLRLNLNDKAYKNVSHVLLDPPCSGSGMIKRHDFLTSDRNEGKDEARLKKLSNLQCMMLRHALSLPSLRRLVYSTCSIFDEENEQVVEEVLRMCGSKFKLVEAMPEWKHRGRRNYSIGRMCLRASPEKDRTNGFFVAVFEAT